MNELEPYKPAHPKAEKYRRRVKGATIERGTKKALPKHKLLKDICRRFRIENKECKMKDSELSLVLSTFGEFLWDMTLNNRDGAKLPVGFGDMRVLMYPPAKYKKRVDKFTSEKLGYTVHFNSLKGKFPHVTWEKNISGCKMANKDLWEFKALRKHKGSVREVFLKNRKKYSDASDRNAAYLRKDRFYRREYARKRAEESLVTYNEFEGLF